MRNRIPKHFGDLVVSFLLVLFIATAGIAAIGNAHNTSNKLKCATNLHQIGLAILLYQQDNRQLYPRTVVDNTGDPKPVWGTPYEVNKDLGAIKGTEPFGGGKAMPAPNDVTAAMFLLMRNEQITSGAFVCPDSKLKPWDFAGEGHTAQDWTNWQGNDCLAKHLSYSYENPYPSKTAIENGWQLKNPDATYAIVSDMNPGGDAIKTVTLRSNAEKLRPANSLNHHQQGQNVLYGDGHVEWQTTPFAGTQHDNIFTASGPELDEPGRGTAAVITSSCGPTDSILLPTAADIGYKGPPEAKPLTAADTDRLKKEIQGTYGAQFPGPEHRHAVLTIDAKTLRCTVGPATILFDYEVTGEDEDGLQLTLTAPDTKTTAKASLVLNRLNLEMTGEFALDFPWQRAGTETTTTQP